MPKDKMRNYIRKKLNRKYNEKILETKESANPLANWYLKSKSSAIIFSTIVCLIGLSMLFQFDGLNGDASEDDAAEIAYMTVSAFIFYVGLVLFGILEFQENHFLRFGAIPIMIVSFFGVINEVWQGIIFFVLALKVIIYTINNR